MTITDPESYAVLRRGGASQARACAEMGVSSGRASALEAGFRVRARRRCGAEAPLAGVGRDRRHVTAVLRQGGFPALPR